jgi:adenine-specific DNA-methyltransferase
VLKLLQKSYAGKVKLIYIDPPYNTGRDFVYPDTFQESIKNYLELTGQVDGGAKITSNTEASGRFHTDWLNMMYPRLKLAVQLLRQDGVIFVSIDDVEVANLRLCIDEICGEENLLAIMIHQRAKGGGQAKHVVRGHDYIVVFAKNIEECPPLRREKVVQGKVEIIDGKEYLVDNDVVRKRFGKYDKSAGDRRCFYEELVKYKGEAAKAQIDERIASGELFLAPWDNGMQVICRRTLIEDASSKLYSIIRVLSEEGKKDLEALGLESAFSYPKPVNLLTQLIRSATSIQADDIVLDCFAGSGTTGHAVAALNAADGGNRRYILIQLPEPLDAANREQKAAAELCDAIKRPRNIAEVTKERLRRAGRNIRNDNPLFAGDVGFRAFKLYSSNLRSWEADRNDLNRTLLDAVEHVKQGRTESDVMYELLLKLGLDLCVPIESKAVIGHTIHSVGGGVLMACLSEQIGREDVEHLALALMEWRAALTPAGDTTCVFRDSAFADDVAKTNMAAILEQHGIATVRSL